MCLREKSFTATWGALGVAGGGGRIGSSVAEDTARNESKREAVTRLAELHEHRRRMLLKRRRKCWVKGGSDKRMLCCCDYYDEGVHEVAGEPMYK